MHHATILSLQPPPPRSSSSQSTSGAVQVTQPVNGSVQAFYNVVHPALLTARPPIGGLPPEDSGDAAWTLRLQLQLLFPR